MHISHIRRSEQGTDQLGRRSEPACDTSYTHPLKCFRAICDRSLDGSKGSHSCERPAQPPPARASRMASSASRLGLASRTSVARLRPAESDVRGMPSTRSKTVGAVRQVRGSAEVGFWVVCWVARGGARQLAAAGSGSGAAERGRGAVYRASPWTGGVWRLFWLTHSPGAATDRPHGGACLGAQVGRLGSSFGPTMRSWRVSRTRAQWRLSPPP